MKTEGQRNEIDEHDLIALLRMKIENQFNWSVIEEIPEKLELGANIREESKSLIKELADSIAAKGQLQECTGDTLEDGRFRVVAGQHRYWAVEAINKDIAKHNSENPDDYFEFVKLRVRVSDRTFTPFEILDIQITENLHKDMEPEEEAEAISALFDFYEEVSDIEGVDGSVADFSRRVGKGESKVRNAIKFMGVNKEVRKLVERDALLYSVATKLARFPYEKQFDMANRIILYNLSGSQIDNFIKGQLDQSLSLFNEPMWAELKGSNHRLAFRTAADKAAQSASGYFERILTLLNMVDEPERVTMTDTIRDILAGLIHSSFEFDEKLKEKSPKLYKLIQPELSLKETNLNVAK